MDYIYIEPKNLSNEICDEIIEKFNSGEKNQIKKEGVILNEFKIQMHSEKWKNIDEILFQHINDKIYYYLRSFIFTNKYFQKIIETDIKDSGFKIEHYKKNEGIFEYHLESLHVDENNYPYIRGNQILKYIWYLNDVDEGGETEICGNFNIKPEVGKLVMFPATWTYPNKEIVPESNDKYIITGFIQIFDKKP